MEQLFRVFLELLLADKTSFLLRLPRAETLVDGVSCVGRFSQSIDVTADLEILLDIGVTCSGVDSVLV